MKKILSGLLILLFAVSMTACKKDIGGKSTLAIPGVDGPKLHIIDDKLLISMVFENLTIDGGLRYPIPQYPNSHIEIAPDFESDGTLMVVAVDLDDVFSSSLDLLDPMTLPGGRALPGVASGKLPAVAFSIPKWKNLAFYLGPKLFGIFVPVPNLDMAGVMVTARFYAGGKRQGNVSLVGEDTNDENSGFLLMLDLDSTTKKKLKYLANKY